MRRIAYLSLALALGLTSATLVACGSRSGLFTAHKATAMETDLNALSTAVAQHDCTDANTQLGRARDVLQSVQNASAALKARVSAEFDHLTVLANAQCTTTTSTTTSSSSTPTTSTSTTSTTTSSTTPTSSSTTTSTPTTSIPLSTDTGGGVGPGNNGNGNGNGNGPGPGPGQGHGNGGASSGGNGK